MDIFNTDKYYVPKHKVPELIRMGFPEIENPLYEQAFEWFRDRHYFHYYFLYYFYLINLYSYNCYLNNIHISMLVYLNIVVED